MNRYRTGTGWIDRYRNELDRNYRDGCSVPFRPTIYRDGTGMERDGINGITYLESRYFKK
ncbi:hypothetical protein H5410_057766 [Solanum commersonii]|uniref:Uncharacterized protein n=1 Tax=Solanum commersonii TaxID=4109 RepID=A0A9J5WRJ3_SOLCO|nr:hypothetical protein H5410_057766 [Solanum commersonii]